MSGARHDRRSLVGNALVVAALALAAIAWFVVEGGLRRPDVGAERWLAFAGVVLAYGALCGVFVAKARRGMRPVRIADDDTVLVAYATQTGFAEELATRTVAALTAAGHRAVATSLASVDREAFATTRTALFIVATYGEGEPPDGARRFAADLMRAPLALSRLRYGVLALGDRAYARYCGFGRDLDAWLAASGAEAAFARIDVDNGSADDLAAWQQALRRWTGADATLRLPTFEPWRLVGRRLANPGSVGHPAFHIALQPTIGKLDWEAGDIALVALPGGGQRGYSIASLPSDGRVELLVRHALRPDGEPGRGAHWLTSALPEHGTTGLRIRANHGFRLPAASAASAASPLIAIGNGTGIAGLRAHLKARERQGAHRNWLFFGERNEAADAFYADELAAWRRGGHLERLSVAFSRDGATKSYVQDRLIEERSDVEAWIADGAIVLVCGSAAGMAPAVDAALERIIGRPRLDRMTTDGRYRRDVY